MAKGFPIFSTVVLRTTKVDLATPMTVMGKALASSNNSLSRRLKMVRRQNTKTTFVARSRAGIAASIAITRINAT